MASSGLRKQNTLKSQALVQTYERKEYDIGNLNRKRSNFLSQASSSMSIQEYGYTGESNQQQRESLNEHAQKKYVTQASRQFDHMLKQDQDKKDTLRRIIQKAQITSANLSPFKKNINLKFDELLQLKKKLNKVFVNKNQNKPSHSKRAQQKELSKSQSLESIDEDVYNSNSRKTSAAYEGSSSRRQSKRVKIEEPGDSDDQYEFELQLRKKQEEKKSLFLQQQAISGRNNANNLGDDLFENKKESNRRTQNKTPSQKIISLEKQIISKPHLQQIHHAYSKSNLLNSNQENRQKTSQFLNRPIQVISQDQQRLKFSSTSHGGFMTNKNNNNNHDNQSQKSLLPQKIENQVNFNFQQVTNSNIQRSQLISPKNYLNSQQMTQSIWHINKIHQTNKNCEHNVIQKIEEHQRKIHQINEENYEPELKFLIDQINHKDHEIQSKISFIPQCCRDQSSTPQLFSSDSQQKLITSNLQRSKQMSPILQSEIANDKKSILSLQNSPSRLAEFAKTFASNFNSQAYSHRQEMGQDIQDLQQCRSKFTSNQMKMRKVKIFHHTQVPQVRTRQFQIENEDLNAIATQNLYQKAMMRYDPDLLQMPNIQIKIILSELQMLKSKANQLRDLLVAKRNEIPRIFSSLQKGYQVNFNSKFEQIIAYLIKVSTVLLQEFAKDPSGVGIPDISYITEDISQVDDESKAFKEDLDVFNLVLRYFAISTDVYIILSHDFERDRPQINQIIQVVRQMAKTRFLQSELINIYRELSMGYEKKVERRLELQEQINNNEGYKEIYYELKDKQNLNIKIQLPKSKLKEIAERTSSYYPSRMASKDLAHLVQDTLSSEDQQQSIDKNKTSLQQTVDKIRIRNRKQEKLQNIMQEALEKKQKVVQRTRKKMKSDQLYNIQRNDLQAWQIDEEDEKDLSFGSKRKICKKNIADQTKQLIEKFQSKKKNKEGSYQQRIIQTAREQADEVKLENDKEDDIHRVKHTIGTHQQNENVSKQKVKETENKFYKAMRKLKGTSMSEQESKEQLILNRLKYNMLKDISEIEKAIEFGNKTCKSKQLKVGLQNLHNPSKQQPSYYGNSDQNYQDYFQQNPQYYQLYQQNYQDPGNVAAQQNLGDYYSDPSSQYQSYQNQQHSGGVPQNTIRPPLSTQVAPISDKQIQLQNYYAEILNGDPFAAPLGNDNYYVEKAQQEDEQRKRDRQLGKQGSGKYGDKYSNNPNQQKAQMFKEKQQMQQELIKDQNMSEQAKNARIVEEVLTSKDYEQELKVKQIENEILQELPRCEMHPKNIFQNQKCRHCKKIREEFEARKQEKLDQLGQQSSTGLEVDGQIKLPVDQLIKTNYSFPMHGDEKKGNLSDLLRNNILSCQYFKDLYALKSFNEVIEEINTHVTYCEPWVVGANGVPSTLYCCLYKLILMKLTEKQVQTLLRYKKNANVRVCGVLYVRYLSPPDQIWERLSPLLLEEDKFQPSYDKNRPMVSFGEFVQQILSEKQYYTTVFPRMPLLIDRDIQKKLLTIPEIRSRKLSNQEKSHLFKKGMTIYAQSKKDNQWHKAQIVGIHYQQNQNQQKLQKQKEEEYQLQEDFFDENFEDDEEDEEEVQKIVRKLQVEFIEGFAVNPDEKQHQEILGLEDILLINKKDEKQKGKERYDGLAHKRKRSKSNDSWGDKEKFSNNNYKQNQERKSKRSRSRSKSPHNKTNDDFIEPGSLNNEERLMEEVLQKQREQASSHRKEDYSKRPASYKNALSLALPVGTTRNKEDRGRDKRSPERQHVYIENPAVYKGENTTSDKKENSVAKEQLQEKMRLLKEKYTGESLGKDVQQQQQKEQNEDDQKISFGIAKK